MSDQEDMLWFSLAFAVIWVAAALGWAGIVVLVDDGHPWVTWAVAWLPVLCVSVAALIFAFIATLRSLGATGR